MDVGMTTELSEGGMGGGNSYFQETLDPGIDGVIAPPPDASYTRSPSNVC